MSGPQHEADQETLAASVRAGHEADSIASRPLFRAALAFIAITMVGVVAVYILQPLMVGNQEAKSPPVNPLAAKYGRLDPPAPRLQVDPALDIYEHRKAEERVLGSYGWVDQQAGVVRIPIDRAMALLAERGLPPASAQGAAVPATGAQP